MLEIKAIGTVEARRCDFSGDLRVAVDGTYQAVYAHNVRTQVEGYSTSKIIEERKWYTLRLWRHKRTEYGYKAYYEYLDTVTVNGVCYITERHLESQIGEDTDR